MDSSNVEINDFKIYVFAGIAADISKLDLSFLNCKFFKIGTDEFNQYLMSVCSQDNYERNIKLFEDLRNGKWFADYLYALTPSDFSLPEVPYLPHEVQAAFLIMFPSDFKLYSTITFQIFEGKVHRWILQETSNFTPSNLSDVHEHLFYFNDEQIEEVLAFLRLYFGRKDRLKYLNTAIESYLSSFYQQQNHMAYISLCICIESIIDGRSELIYRMRRNCAVINGRTKEESRIIFKNFNKLYDLRSIIVHGSTIDYLKVSEFYPKLRALVSRTLIELFILNIESVEKLNELLTESGFGDKENLIENYQELNLDIITLTQMRRAL